MVPRKQGASKQRDAVERKVSGFTGNLTLEVKIRVKGSPKISHLKHRKENSVDDYQMVLCGARINEETRKRSQDGEVLTKKWVHVKDAECRHQVKRKAPKR